MDKKIQKQSFKPSMRQHSYCPTQWRLKGQTSISGSLLIEGLVLMLFLLLPLFTVLKSHHPKWIKELNRHEYKILP